MNWRLECQTCAKAKRYGCYGCVLPCDDDKCEQEGFQNSATTNSVYIGQYQSNKTEVEN